MIARLLRDERGGDAVEMGLLLVMLSLMLFGTMFTGWMLWSAHTLHYAVEESARCAAIDVNNCGSVADTQAYAVAKAMGLAMAAGQFSVTQPASGCGWQVQATYDFPLTIPFMPASTVAIGASSCYPLNN
jgi:Flp pilus assembly protein TadG